MIVLFTAIALTEFIEHVRTVQVLGLLACGAGIGVSAMRLIYTARQGAKKV